MKDIPFSLEEERSPFLRQVREVIRTRGLAYKTEKTYLGWIRKFIFFVINNRHPKDVDAPEVSAFLSHLALNRNVSVNTQKVALNTIIFLYRDVIIRPLGELAHSYAKKSIRIPTVFTHEEACCIINKLNRCYHLIAEPMYACGLRISEAIRLRIKDIDFGMNVIIVRNSKGNKDRVTVLPAKLR